ncbi:phosphate/phosphite/phosphonate ABC transporter substrate-binding protein [Pseudobacteriovorax antillogorgiicola]|uniref:Phosphonate transport system substrate-binding protein n=1 Tax=Pseudobacteriovorax antillogorgiicola TaxID=1513793 RepID=A0A1Y6CBV6_9BACT|nr:phosphate/phosphite/phosphonate ABC transporter substrate-binding protein [Pseudobacteriovorax antillogorgiicola]TCS48961.1 phosphonate transport system substrate-binding protein [Pseudobacteriovorax antillogorgiicola]SMF53681.1 phosphonate transport system substrate-binding protein [Pseudobacteriovorax antillogorgiicola]
MNRTIKSVALLAGMFLGTQVSAETLTFAIVPQQSASKLAKKWVPICNYLSEQTGLKIVFETAPNIPEFELRLAQGRYDLAYMNPYHFVVFHEKSSYQAMAKAKDKRIKGIFVVKKDSNLETIHQLHDSRLAFPSPAAFAASILPRSELNQRSINFTPQYVSSHDSVYRNVSLGVFPAGGGVKRTFNNLDPEVRKDLRILWETKPYTPHAIAFKKNLPADLIQKIRSTLLGMDQSEGGKSLLKSISLKGFEGAQNKDWDDVRALNISELD